MVRYRRALALGLVSLGFAGVARAAVTEPVQVRFGADWSAVRARASAGAPRRRGGPDEAPSARNRGAAVRQLYVSETEKGTEERDLPAPRAGSHEPREKCPRGASGDPGDGDAGGGAPRWPREAPCQRSPPPSRPAGVHQELREELRAARGRGRGRGRARGPDPLPQRLRVDVRGPLRRVTGRGVGGAGGDALLAECRRRTPGPSGGRVSGGRGEAPVSAERTVAGHARGRRVPGRAGPPPPTPRTPDCRARPAPPRSGLREGGGRVHHGQGLHRQGLRLDHAAPLRRPAVGRREPPGAPRRGQVPHRDRRHLQDGLPGDVLPGGPPAGLPLAR